MEMDDLLVQDLADEWAKSHMKELVKEKRDKRSSLMIFGLEKDHIPIREERVAKEKKIR